MRQLSRPCVDFFNIFAHLSIPKFQILAAKTIRQYCLAGALLLAFGAVAQHSSPDPTSSSQDSVMLLFYQGFDALYRFHPDEAKAVLDRFKERYPDHIMTYSYAVNYYWWMIISGENIDDSRKRFKQHLKEGLALADHQIGDREPTYLQLYFYITMYGYKARFDVLNNDYFKALVHMRDCLRHLESSLGKEEAYQNFYLTSGLYNFNFAFALKNYPFVFMAAWFYPKGDMEKGIRQLQYAANSDDPILQLEGNYFLMRIYFELTEDFEKAMKYAEELIRLYPSNLYFHFIKFHILVTNDHYPEAVSQWEIARQLPETNPHITEAQMRYYQEIATKKLKKHHPDR